MQNLVGQGGKQLSQGEVTMSGGETTSTKSVVWKEGTPLTAKIVSPEYHGTSKEYWFGPDNNHTAEMDEADAAALLNTGDKDVFRIKASR